MVHLQVIGFLPLQVKKKGLLFCSEEDWYLGVAEAAVFQTSRSYLQLSFLKTLPFSPYGLASQATSTIVFQRSKILLQRCLGCFAPSRESAICCICSGNQKCCVHLYILNADVWLKYSGMMLFWTKQKQKMGIWCYAWDCPFRTLQQQKTLLCINIEG